MKNPNRSYIMSYVLKLASLMGFATCNFLNVHAVIRIFRPLQRFRSFSIGGGRNC